MGMDDHRSLWFMGIDGGLGGQLIAPSLGLGGMRRERV